MSSNPCNPHLLTIHESAYLTKGQLMFIPKGATILLVVEQSFEKPIIDGL